MVPAAPQKPQQPEAPTDTSAPAPRKPFPRWNQNRFHYPSSTDTMTYRVPGRNGLRQETTKVQSLLGGGQIFNKINEVLDKAKSWVLVDMYNLQSPELYPERTSPENTPGAHIQASLVDRLIQLKNKNVNVRVILDNTKQQPRDGEKLEDNHNERTIAKLKESGIPVLTYPGEASIKSHVKILMADNKHAVIGGMNWGNHSATNHDGAIYIQGPDTRNIFHKVFKPDWITAGGSPSELPPITPFHAGKLKVLQTSGENSEQGAKDEILNGILSQIDQAKNSVHAELFVLTQKQVVDKLIAKHKELSKKGKEGVKILVDPGLFFLFPNCRPGIQKLAKAGVPIRFFKSSREHEEKLHAKWAVFDRKNLLVGSANWSAIGLESRNAADSVNTLANAMENLEVSEDAQRSISKTNHEIAILFEDSGEVGKTFAKQADFDFKNASFPILEKGEDGKWHPIKRQLNVVPKEPDEAIETAEPKRTLHSAKFG
jgi:phosphatidylserine/phosphatidylglycerophosphate/cardiolipin synthase-like enzyme